MYLWMNCLSGIDTLANGGLRMRVGNDTSNFNEYDVAGSDTYTGGWRKRAVSPRATPARTTGTPSLTAVDYFAGFFDVVVSIMGNFNNALVDALDLLEAIRMTDGDGTTPGTFVRFQTFDTGTPANQYGVIRDEGGVFFIQGRLYIGDDSTTTLFDDRSGAVVVFEDAQVDTDFYEIRLTASASLQLGELSGGAPIAGATILSSGPAWYLNLSAGTADLYGCTFGQTRISTLTSNVTAINCAWVEGGTITADGADLTGSRVINPTVAADGSAVAWNVATDPDGLVDGMLIQKGAEAHHALEFGTSSPTTSITLRGIDFIGFNASNAQNDSTFNVLRTSGTVTINIVGCTGNFSYKTAGAAVVVVEDPVTLTITAVDSQTGDPIQGARALVLAGTSYTGGDAVSITRSGSTATVAHTSHGFETGDLVRVRGAVEQEYNGIFTVTVTGANEYTYTVSGTPATPATGSPVSVLVIVDALTNASGQVSDTRSWGSNQAFVGRLRRGSTAPTYKTQPVSGTIDSAAGASATVALVSDA
jgi:hypothetical protein